LPYHGKLLYVDDLVVIAKTEDDLIKRLNEWKDNVENRSMRITMNKPYGHDASRSPGCHLDIRAQIQKSRESRCVCRWIVLCPNISKLDHELKASRVWRLGLGFAIT